MKHLKTYESKYIKTIDRSYNMNDAIIAKEFINNVKTLFKNIYDINLTIEDYMYLETHYVANVNRPGIEGEWSSKYRLLKIIIDKKIHLTFSDSGKEDYDNFIVDKFNISDNVTITINPNQLKNISDSFIEDYKLYLNVNKYNL